MLGPYLKGGGAKSLDFQSLSQDLIRTSMQIPFSVPPYMSLLARSTATLEGIALMGDPNYQMVSQVCRSDTCADLGKSFESLVWNEECVCQENSSTFLTNS